MTAGEQRHPAEGIARAPAWVYSDRALVDDEQDRIL
jgi:hypothetical protein